MTDKELPMPSRQKDLYDNWKVYSSTEKLMFRCSKKKADWYLARDLAIVLPEDKAIKLLFVAKGDGHAEGDYMIEDKANICVSCGSPSALTLHHIGKEQFEQMVPQIEKSSDPIYLTVPDMYRKWMPEVIKSKSSRDLVILCKNCHLKYESCADAYKDTIARDYDMPLEGRGWILTPENSVVRKAASAVIKYRDGKLPYIPLERIEYLQDVIENWRMNECRDSSMEDALVCALELTDRHKGPDFEEHGEHVIAMLMRSSITTEEGRLRWRDLEEFVKSWRRHFLKHCNCKYLSAKWSVDADIYVE